MKLSHIFTNKIKPGKIFQIPDQPVNVMLDVTNYCNNKCLFCYNPHNDSYKNDVPQPVELEKIVAKIGESGTKEILYLGGEPFSNSTIGRLLEIGSKYGMFQRAVSNGSFLKELDGCLHLKKKGLNEIGISLHSSSPSIHDKLAGRKGAFRDAISALENCVNAGIKTFVQYSPNTLNAENDLLILANYVSELSQGKVAFYDINRLLPVGAGHAQANLILKDDQWFYFLSTTTKLDVLGYEVHAELTPYCWINMMGRNHSTPNEQLAKMHKFNRGCFMWVAQLPLDYHGRIKFCPAGPPVGPSLLDVQWPDFWREWKGFKEYRSFLWNDKCIDFDTHKACQYFYQCLGGCKYSNGNHYEVDQYSQGMKSIAATSG